MRIHKINLKQGSGSILLGTAIMLLGLLFIVMMMMYSSLYYGNAVVQTRTDAIADSTAVYAQAFDYNYNQGQAMAMAKELTNRNNEANPVFELTTELKFPEDNILTVNGKVTSPMLYANIVGTNYVFSYAESTVKSVDIYGQIFVIPDLK